MDSKKRSFEQMLEELETIVSKLESGNESLEEMVKLYERGAKLGQNCMQMLDSYQGRIEILQNTEKDIGV